MTNERQPEALRLAKILEDHYFYSDTNEAAAGLRRLYEENEDYGATIDYLTCENAEQIGEIVALKEQRDELLAALKLLEEAYCADDYGTREGRAKGRAALIATRAAIAKAGGAA